MKKLIITLKFNCYAWTLILLPFVLCFMLIACDGLLLNGGNGLFSVTIGGDNARVAVPWANTLDSNSLVHTITVSGGEGEPQTGTIPAGGGKAQFTVIPGEWTITAEARNLSGEVIAVGSLRKQINPGNNGDLTLQMQEPASHPSFTVGFDSKGGSAVPNQTVKKYSKTAQPAPPTYESKVFDGWYMDSGFAALYNFDAPVTGDIILFAKWLTITVVDVTGVSINKTTTIITVNGTETLFAIISPSNATNQNVSWSSGDTSVATVSGSGVVSGVSEGSAVITVSTVDGNKTASCSVTVSTAAVAVTGVSLNKTTMVIDTGSTETLSVSFEPSNATNQNVSWSSSNEDIATVSMNGTVTGLAEGSAVITASTEDGNKTAACSVSVITPVAVTGVSLNKDALELNIGTSETLSANISPANATNQNITWSSSDASVATVSESGLVSGITAGEAVITVTTEDGSFSAICAVSVTAVAVTGVTLNKSSTSITIGAFETLTATIAPFNATNRNVSWSSSNSSVASVSSSGVVYGASAGSATITVTTVDGNKTATCSVTVSAVNQTPVAADFTITGLGTFPASGAFYAVLIQAKAGKSPGLITVYYNGSVTAPSAAGNYVVTFDVAAAQGWNAASGLPAGTLVITSGSTTVSVTDVTLNKSSTNITVGDTETLSANIIPSNATNKAVTWSSSDASVATVSAGGVVTGKLGGSATITVTTADGNKTANCTVTVNAGAGTTADPFIVHDAETLQRVGKGTGAWTGDWSMSASYIQTANIDLSSVTNWTPIGSSSDFTGSYDGDGYTINNLTINNPTADRQGLFGSLSGSSTIVKNIGLVNCSITGKGSVGGVVGIQSYSTVQNCYVTGTVSGISGVGGVAGESSTGTVQNSHSMGTVSGTQQVGGVVGINGSGGTVENCYSTGNVSGTGVNGNVGGVAGSQSGGTVKNCYSTGAVSGGGGSVGGVVGSSMLFSLWGTSGTVENCYSTGNVSGTSGVGGVLGGNTSSYLRNCYSTGDVSGTTNVGGVVGGNSMIQDKGICRVENCYATGNVSGTGDYVGGVAGSRYYANVKNCAALNPNISGTSSILGRVAGDGDVNINNIYGREDMNKDGSAATWANNPSGDKDGADVTAADWSSESWWTGTAGFSASVWDFSGISATKGPSLSGMQGGPQNPVIQ